MNFRFGPGVIALALALLAPLAHGGESGPLHDRFELSLGTYLYTSDTNVRADAIGGIGQGTDFNLEQVFRFDDQSVFRGEAAWRIRPRHGIRFMYFEIDRAKERSLDHTLEFDGQTFPVGIWARAEVGTQIMQLAYDYNFLRRENYELGASIGVHHVKFSTELRGSIEVGEQGEVSGAVRGDVSTEVPLPVAGLHGTWNVWGDLYLQGHAKYFSARYQEYDGNLLDFQASVLWNFSRHLGVGVGYNAFRADVKMNDAANFIGRLRWNYDGAQLFVRAAF